MACFINYLLKIACSAAIFSWSAANAGGYVTDGQGQFIRSSSGECVKLGAWSALPQVTGCDVVVKPVGKPNAKPIRIILLPDLNGKTGALIVRDQYGEQLLKDAYAGLQAGTGEAMKRVDESESSVRSRYGDVLDARSPRPINLLVRFETGSATKLTSDSVLIFAEMDKILSTFPSPQLMIVGHTDTIGASRANDELSLKRAQTVARYLSDRGISADRIETAGRGERELLVPTADGVADARNRRVEITIR